MRVLSVNSLKLSILKSNPPQLMIDAGGFVGTPGWTDIKLAPMEDSLSEDGILDLEFVGTPPTVDAIIQVIRPVHADLIVREEVDKIVGVLVHARTNTLLELLGTARDAEQPSDNFTTLAVGEENTGGGVTTLALGEEKIPSGETLHFGETTERFGEESFGFGKSPVFGEEKFPEGEKTGPGFETEAIGETGFAGETHFMGESGPAALETDPVGENFDDVLRNRIRTPFNRR